MQSAEPDDLAIEKVRVEGTCSSQDPFAASTSLFVRARYVARRQTSRAGASDWSHPIPAAVGTASASSHTPWLSTTTGRLNEGPLGTCRLDS